MRKLGLWAVRPKRNTSKRHPTHKVYPYLLRDLPNQGWAADITYIAMRQGFLYLVAVIDWATRRVLSWRLSNTLTAGFCVEALSEALARFGKPGIFNIDQGAQLPAMRIDHEPDQGAVAPASVRRHIDAVEQRARFGGIEHRRLPAGDDVARAPHRTGGVHWYDLAGDEPIK
jgi:transposase InsO family protein